MSLEPPTYIFGLSNNIRARPISWEGAVRAKTITDNDLKKIKAIDKVRKEQRKQEIEKDVDVYTSLLLGGELGDPARGQKSIFESTAKRTDILQYMLVLTGDLIDDVPALANALVRHPHPYKPFLPLLKQSSNPEDPIPLLTSSVLSSLLSHAMVAQPRSNAEIDEALPKLYSYVAQLNQTTDSNLQDIAVQEYSALLRTDKSRRQFWNQRKETLGPLIDVLRNATGGKDSDSTLHNGDSSRATSIRSVTEANIKLGSVGLQLLYHVLLCLWQLSFEGGLVGKGLDEEHDIIPLYTSLLRVSPKEKTTRLLLSTLNNLFKYNKTALLPAAIPARLPEVLRNLKARKLSDQDLIEDLDNLSEMLNEYTQTQLTFSAYTDEIKSGHLRWSPPHKNRDFWRENARKIIEEENGELCKQLTAIMQKNWKNDKQVLAIGSNDIAALVKECPEKRGVLERMGLKARVMALMQDENESVRWEALRAVGEWLRYNFDSSSSQQQQSQR